MQRGIEVGFGPTLPSDMIPNVPYLPFATPVRVLLNGKRCMHGRVVGVLIDNGRRGTVRNGQYQPSTNKLRQDIAPNVACYLIEEDDTGREFECHPSKVLSA